MDDFVTDIYGHAIGKYFERVCCCSKPSVFGHIRTRSLGLTALFFSVLFIPVFKDPAANADISRYVQAYSQNVFLDLSYLGLIVRGSTGFCEKH